LNVLEYNVLFSDGVLIFLNQLEINLYKILYLFFEDGVNEADAKCGHEQPNLCPSRIFCPGALSSESVHAVQGQDRDCPGALSVVIRASSPFTVWLSSPELPHLLFSSSLNDLQAMSEIRTQAIVSKIRRGVAVELRRVL
jgi:hypothetical protein